MFCALQTAEYFTFSLFRHAFGKEKSSSKDFSKENFLLLCFLKCELYLIVLVLLLADCMR